MKLHLADHLALPPDAVTQTFGVLGARGSGKSNAAVVMAEEMFRAKIHWVAIDPKGDWWGIRSSADGKHPGLPVVVFGGRHGDVPLEPGAGPLLADLIVDQTMTAVLDLSEFTEGEKIHFLAGQGSQDGFAHRLYRRKSEEQPPTHLFLEEADDYLPQKAMRDKAKLLHDVTRLFLWGRQRGVGGTIITQRSARIHKDSFSQIGTLFAFRTGDPRDQKAILDWVRYHGLAEEVMQSLSGLADGEGWVWSPEWLKVMKRVQFRHRATYDSGRTPELGARARAPATLADVDLGAIQTQMAATIEKARAEDPKELRKRIADLEKQLRERPVELKPEVRVERVEVPVLKNGQLDKALKFANRLDAVLAQVSELAGSLKQSIARAAQPAAAPKPSEKVQYRPPPRPQPAPQPRAASTPGETSLGAARQRILDALSWLESVRVPQAKRTQLALLAEQSPTSSAFGNNLGALKNDKGMHPWPQLIDYPGPGLVRLTDAGRRAAQTPDVPATTVSMHEALFARLPAPQTRILQALIAAYPAALDREQLAEQTGQSATSSAYGNNLGALRSLGLIDYPVKGQVAALPVLFLD